MKINYTALLALLLGALYTFGQSDLTESDTDTNEEFEVYEYTQPGEEEYWKAQLYYSLGKDREKEARAYLEKSVELGFIPAVLRKGLMYAEGEGGYTQSNRSAHKHFLRASEAGEGSAMFNLAYTYAEGLGC